MQDEKIIDLFWERDEAAIREAQKKYHHYLKTVAYHILWNEEDAEETVNDAYFKAWESASASHVLYFFMDGKRFCISL